MSIFDKLLGRTKEKSKEDRSKKYENEKLLAFEGTPKKRLSLAKNTKTHKEILFYLAENDPDEKVRQAVAKNKSTPLHAAATLAIDKNTDVRIALAGRLVKLLPDVSVDTQSQLYAFAVQALGTLALDEVLKIRKSLSSTLKDHAFAPPAVAAQLAKDIEREVSEPILLFCTSLQDSDLVDILSSHPKAWAAEAVAKRPKISERVSRAVIDTGNVVAGKLLLENKGANITANLLQDIVARAREFPEWHEPLATRHHLTPDMAKRLARFVDARIRKLLEDKGHYDLQVTEVVTDATRRRIKLEEEIQSEDPDDPKAIYKRVRKYHAAGRLNEEIIGDHLALRQEEFLIEALILLSGATRAQVTKIFSIKKPEMICALCWKAGLSMRFAFRVQQDVVKLSKKEIIVPKGGTDYPLEEKDMIWQLEFVGITV